MSLQINSIKKLNIFKKFFVFDNQMVTYIVKCVTV